MFKSKMIEVYKNSIPWLQLEHGLVSVQEPHVSPLGKGDPVSQVYVWRPLQRKQIQTDEHTARQTDTNRQTDVLSTEKLRELDRDR